MFDKITYKVHTIQSVHFLGAHIWIFTIKQILQRYVKH